MKTYRFRTFSLALFGSGSRSKRSSGGAMPKRSSTKRRPTSVRETLWYGKKPGWSEYTLNWNGNSKKG